MGVGAWIAGLSDRARLGLTAGLFFILIGWSVYKLATAWPKLQQPAPKLNPQEIIEPMQQLFNQVKNPSSNLRQDRHISRLDSLAKEYLSKQPRKR
ncbi:hypothetical protein DUE52_23680 [Larkinella punicea]|uniref:Uncharacterized protein n=2 Tax=Spirosomataceae TaxID=2896860 RepID=A0A368JHB6_9BACT|nr:hypothetical protein DUE52_23680 [Larkinella punicea]